MEQEQCNKEQKILSDNIDVNSNLQMPENEIVKICYDICKKTCGYQLDKIRVNNDGTNTHIHSDMFLDEHPERRDSPEFTDEEEKEQANFIAAFAKLFH